MVHVLAVVEELHPARVLVFGDHREVGEGHHVGEGQKHEVDFEDREEEHAPVEHIRDLLEFSEELQVVVQSYEDY